MNPDLNYLLIAVALAVLFLLALIIFMASRYRRCPSNKILAVFGKVGGGQSVRCFHGGGAFVWPLIQDSAYLDLIPLTLQIGLKSALSLQNIRIDVPSIFTIAIGTTREAMTNAAVRLLGLAPRQIEQMATEIILGQLRLTVASLTIEQIIQDREKFMDSIRRNVEPELEKIGLTLINVNVTDITDESDYIESIGRKAASTAVNQAKIDVAEQEKHGRTQVQQLQADTESGVAAAMKIQRISVAALNADAVQGEAEAQKNQRVRVAALSAEAIQGEADAEKNQRVRVAALNTEASIGVSVAEREQRIKVSGLNSEAVEGENSAKAKVAAYNATLAQAEAEALKRGQVTRQQAEAEIQNARAQAETARLQTEEVVPRQVEKRKVEIDAEAAAEKRRREAKGEADAILALRQAEAEGILKTLDAKARGYRGLVEACGGNAKDLATLLLLEKLEHIVHLQTEAIKNLRIDKITVWDSGNSEKGSSTAGFLSNLIKSLPPLHDLAAMTGLDLPEFLGKVHEQAQTVANGEKPAAGKPVA